MKKVLFSFEMPRGTYCGGVATMINAYMAQRDIFCESGFAADLFDYKDPDFIRKLPSKLRNVLYGILQRRAILRQLKKEPVDLVHIHTSRDFLYLKDVWLARAIKRRTGTAVAITVHVGAAQTVFSRIGFAGATSLRWINRYVDRMIFLTQGIREEFCQLGMAQDKGAVLGNFHDLQPMQQTDILPRKAALHLLFVGAIHRDKGILELLTALAELPELDIHLDVCGTLTDQSIREQFEERIAQLGERVMLHGYVSGTKKAALFERADALVLPSYHEGFPLVVLEALAGGCAVISTPVGATPEILDTSNALWVRIKSSADVKDAMVRLYTDMELRCALQQNNRALSERFSVDAHIESLCKLYFS